MKLFSSRKDVDPQNEKSERFLEFFDFRPETEILKDPYHQAEMLWCLVLMVRKLKDTAETKASNPNYYPLAYRRQSSDYREAVVLARDFCSDMSDIPLHWAALDGYIKDKRTRGMRGHRVFNETLDLD